MCSECNNRGGGSRVPTAREGGWGLGGSASELPPPLLSPPRSPPPRPPSPRPALPPFTPPPPAPPAPPHPRRRPPDPEQGSGRTSSPGQARTPARWGEVGCLGGNVVKLDVGGKSVKGTLSPALGVLTGLTDLNVENNAIQGPIPDSYGGVMRLVRLSFGANLISGSVPGSFIALTQLTRLNSEPTG